MKPSSQAGTPTKRGVLSRRNIVILTAALVLVGGSALFFGSARTSSAVQKPRAQEPGITVDVVQPAPTMFARNLGSAYAAGEDRPTGYWVAHTVLIVVNLVLTAFFARYAWRTLRSTRQH